MATKETVWEAVQSMASVWKFPGTDLKLTAGAYYSALRDLSDEDVKRATGALLSEWTKTAPPKPADVRIIADELRPLPPRLPRPARHEPTHEEIMAKIRRDNYHVQAIRECGVWDIHPDKWSLEQSRAVSKRQHKLREQYGIPHPMVG